MYGLQIVKQKIMVVLFTIANNTVATQSINNCYFSNNSSNSSGGAIYSLSPLEITNTSFE